ncbi:MAG: hypothetical protein Q4F23_02960, partial [Coriobacteriia bacterium]|nr:hypothetical protein [Coriobacteriia bacterium]
AITITILLSEYARSEARKKNQNCLFSYPPQSARQKQQPIPQLATVAYLRNSKNAYRYVTINE